MIKARHSGPELPLSRSRKGTVCPPFDMQVVSVSNLRLPANVSFADPTC